MSSYVLCVQQPATSGGKPHSPFCPASEHLVTPLLFWQHQWLRAALAYWLLRTGQKKLPWACALLSALLRSGHLLRLQVTKRLLSIKACDLQHLLQSQVTNSMLSINTCNLQHLLHSQVRDSMLSINLKVCSLQHLL